MYKTPPWFAFRIDRKSSVPVFEQICDALRAGIASGEPGEGTRLPPTREFATELGVSRSTVVTAYEQLVAEGYLQGIRGSGYLVCAMGEVELAPQNVRVTPDTTEPAPQEPRAFEAGKPDMRLFPYIQWAKAVSRVCRTHPETMLTGAGRAGNLGLRKAIAKHVFEWRGITASPQQVIITAGSTDALEICLRTLTIAGQKIGVEDPGYVPIHSFARAQGLAPVLLRIDKEGAVLPSSPADMRVAILTPSHQYPLGGAMSPKRRQAFIQWAKCSDAWIIEDDYDSEFRYAGSPIPAMAGFDGLNRTIYVGSFSKIFSNTLRLGYMVIPETLREPVHSTLSGYGIKSSLLPQQALCEFMDSGEFYRHLRRVRRVYGERRRFLVNELTRNFLKYGAFSDHQAGMQIAFHLRPEWNDSEIAARAQSFGVSVEPLSGYCRGAREYNGLLLGYCGFSEAELTDALRGLELAFGA